MKRIALLGLGLAVALAASAFAAKAPKPAPITLPAYFTLPDTVKPATEGGGKVRFEDFGQAEIPVAVGHDAQDVRQGKHWKAPLEVVNPPPKLDAAGAWALLKPALVAGGWTVPSEASLNPYEAVLHYQKDGKETWGFIEIFGPKDMRLDLVELAPSTMTLSAVPPGTVVEPIDLKHGDFPWLPPLPGSGPSHTGHGGVMLVRLPGAPSDEIVGSDSITKSYSAVAGVSTLQFVTVYHDALVKAGWDIVAQSAGLHQSDATLTAHFARNGRNIWAYLHMSGEDYTIKVADAGSADDLAKTFARDCHVALTGVLFDFNKATLKPESDAVLGDVLDFLKRDAALKLEVQGHTDNVGGDDYNQKLSEARAQSVLAWLAAHGVDKARLSFKGYGKTHPVATNDTDEGRAKNRRVEIAKPGCTQ